MSQETTADEDRTRTTGTGSTTAGFGVLWVAIKREPWIFTASTLGSILFGALTVADAWVLGWATDHVVLPAFRDGEIGGGLLWAVLALFLGVAILRAVGIVARRLGAGIMQYRMQAHSRRAVTRQYLRLPMEWHQKHPTGELLSNANADVEAAWGPIAPLPMAVGTVAMMVIAVIQMVIVDLPLATIGLLVFPIVIGTNVVYQRLAQGWATRAQQLRAELSEIAHESFDGALVVKTLGREPEETARFQAKAFELREANIRVGRIRAAFDPTLAALPNLAVLVVLVFGVHRVGSGATAAGDVVTITYLLTVVAFPIRSIGWLLGDFPRSVVGFRRVRSVLRATGAMEYGDTGLDRTATGARLEVDGAAFAYLPGRSLLRDVHFDVPPGRSVALVGATASGKSTLTTLLARLVDIDDGSIRIDGIDVRDLRRGALAEHLALVPQTAFLFDDTVRGNVTLGLDVSDDEVWQALETAQAADFVRALSDGLDTRLGERGTSLSGGQRQRLALARALVRRPRLLILDDATSAVDPEVEAKILAALRLDTPSPGGSGYSTTNPATPSPGGSGYSTTNPATPSPGGSGHSTTNPATPSPGGSGYSTTNPVAGSSSSRGAATKEPATRRIETPSSSPATTLVVVAYRKATIALADEVLFLVDGAIADRGPHGELVARNPDYARLVNAYETEEVSV